MNQITPDAREHILDSTTDDLCLAKHLLFSCELRPPSAVATMAPITIRVLVLQD